MTILAFDPCVTRIYCCKATFDSKTLRSVEFLKDPLQDLPFHSADLVVVESQQVYGGRFAQDLIRLATESGRILGHAAAVNPSVKLLNPLPREWKGQTPKDIHNARTLAKVKALGVDLSLQLKPLRKAEVDDFVDALGLALWAFAKGTGRPL